MQNILYASPRVQIRDWQPGDGNAIYDLLQSADEYGSFNPEGALELDCQTESLLAESYDKDDGGCFLVAEQITEEKFGEDIIKNSRVIVGTAGLIVGTQVQYQASGSSVSTPEMTAAVRRCVVRLSENDDGSTTSIQRQLLAAIDERAIQAKATEVIGLAYPPQKILSSFATKPSLAMMQELAYNPLPQQIPGVDAIQCGKDLTRPKAAAFDIIDSSMINKKRDNNTEATSSADDSSSNDLLEWAVAGTVLGVLLFGGSSLVGQFLGFDTSVAFPDSSTTINRGLGRPLSSQDLGQLLQDEQLQRKTLDNDELSSSDGREWKDLSPEERREELALLQVVQGQNTRVK